MHSSVFDGLSSNLDSKISPVCLSHSMVRDPRTSRTLSSSISTLIGHGTGKLIMGRTRSRISNTLTGFLICMRFPFSGLEELKFRIANLQSTSAPVQLNEMTRGNLAVSHPRNTFRWSEANSSSLDKLGVAPHKLGKHLQRIARFIELDLNIMRRTMEYIREIWVPWLTQGGLFHGLSGRNIF